MERHFTREYGESSYWQPMPRLGIHRPARILSALGSDTEIAVIICGTSRMREVAGLFLCKLSPCLILGFARGVLEFRRWEKRAFNQQLDLRAQMVDR
jgi:hypothetical protein